MNKYPMRWLWIFALVVALPVTAIAETVRDIRIRGNERVENSTILSYLPFVVGQDFRAENIGDVIKSLFATGLFFDVDVSLQQGVVAIDVQENPLVNDVVVEGNESITADILRENLVLVPRAVFTAAKAQRDKQLLEDIYRSRGRFLTQVTPELIEREQNRVDVIYRIEEGEKTKIADIRFIGNRRFTDRDLRDVIATKESAFYRFGSSDTFDENRLEVDQDLLRRYYLQHGYADFQVQSAVAELSRDKSKFYVTFTLVEGDKYDFGAINVAVNADNDDIQASDLQRQITLAGGDLYNATRVEENVDVLVEYLGSRGFAFLDVQPEPNRDEANQTVDITFNINPGPRVYVNRIEIKGNARTQDEVIRRELRLAEGDAFSARKLRRSRDRVNFLGYFKEVDVSRAETNMPDRVDVTVEVEEQSTGEFNIGAGFSTFEGPIATADVRERNFLGRGQDVSVRFALSETRQNYNFSFTEPYFLNQELAAGFDLFNEQTDFQDESSFDLSTTGGALRMRVPISEFSNNTLRLGYDDTEISNVGSQASAVVQGEVGSRNSLALANTYTIDTRDSFLNPTRGYRFSAFGEYSGFGSSTNYLKGLLSGSWHTEVLDDVVLSVGARAGAVHSLDDDLPIYEHFNAGGTTLRGFETSGIGPRDSVTNDALGGTLLLGNNIELSFPMWRLEEFGVRGVLFTDGGIVTEFENAPAVVTDTQTYRVSGGAGVHWQSPVGPLRLEFGVPLVQADEDVTQIFSFSVGSRF